MELVGSSSGLKHSRPKIDFGMVWCCRCNAPCEFDETGGHRLMKGDGSGYIFMRAYCHGEEADIMMTFAQAAGFLWRYKRNKNSRIEVFAPIRELLEQDSST